jgi:thiamine-monophosphate kinase
MTPEFALIAKHFTRPADPERGVLLSVGDDCALLNVTPGKTLAVSTDTLVEGVHFFPDVSPESLGHKALAVNLSDLAAMGATPRFFTLAITLPSVDDEWLTAFARGIFALADAHEIALVGGDTTRGPLSITITVIGEQDVATALRRDAATAGQDIWLSGSVGGAALGLKHLQGHVALKPNVVPRVLARLERPEPRVALGRALLGVATSAIDVSDGLVGDLTHICTKSDVDAVIDWPSLPLHPALLSVGPEMRMQCALAGGDDYELCFTAPSAAREAVHSIATQTDTPATRIGALIARTSDVPRVLVRDELTKVLDLRAMGLLSYDHFSPA